MTERKKYFVELFLQTPNTSYGMLTQTFADSEYEALDNIFERAKEEKREIRGVLLREIEEK